MCEQVPKGARKWRTLGKKRMKYPPFCVPGSSVGELMTKGKVTDLMNTNGIFQPSGLKIYFVGYDKNQI